MIDPTQILLIVVVSVLTILLVFVGVQVFFILREVKFSIQKVNKVLDDVCKISNSVVKPVEILSSSAIGLSALGKLFGSISKRKAKNAEKEVDKNE
ncbi:MAG: hypothetical protein ABIH88_02900 [Patescibacteria group bacterium]|nr:hypothetical protein [Patescibacteria group bacterium]